MICAPFSPYENKGNQTKDSTEAYINSGNTAVLKADLDDVKRGTARTPAPGRADVAPAAHRAPAVDPAAPARDDMSKEAPLEPQRPTGVRMLRRQWQCSAASPALDDPVVKSVSQAKRPLLALPVETDIQIFTLGRLGDETNSIRVDPHTEGKGSVDQGAVSKGPSLSDANVDGCRHTEACLDAGMDLELQIGLRRR